MLLLRLASFVSFVLQAGDDVDSTCSGVVGDSGFQHALGSPSRAFAPDDVCKLSDKVYDTQPPACVVDDTFYNTTLPYPWEIESQCSMLALVPPPDGWLLAPDEHDSVEVYEPLTRVFDEHLCDGTPPSVTTLAVEPLSTPSVATDVISLDVASHLSVAGEVSSGVFHYQIALLAPPDVYKLTPDGPSDSQAYRNSTHVVDEGIYGAPTSRLVSWVTESWFSSRLTVAESTPLAVAPALAADDEASSSGPALPPDIFERTAHPTSLAVVDFEPSEPSSSAGLLGVVCDVLAPIADIVGFLVAFAVGNVGHFVLTYRRRVSCWVLITVE